MTVQTELLEGELAAYSPTQLSEFVDTVSILLEAADDASSEYCSAHARIQTTLYHAVEARMRAEREARQTATIVPFPKVHRDE